MHSLPEAHILHSEGPLGLGLRREESKEASSSLASLALSPTGGCRPPGQQGVQDVRYPRCAVRGADVLGLHPHHSQVSVIRQASLPSLPSILSATTLFP